MACHQFTREGVLHDDFITHMVPGLTLPELECGQKYNLTDSQKALVTILAWIRRKRKGLEFCKKHCIFPGPSGKKEPKKAAKDV